MAYSGVIIYRESAQHQSLQETEAEFESLDDLFELCLSIPDPSRIERLVISGTDEHGHARSTTSGFRMATAESPPEQE